MVGASDGAVGGIVVWELAVKVDCRFMYDLAILGNEDGLEALCGEVKAEEERRIVVRGHE